LTLRIVPSRAQRSESRPGRAPFAIRRRPPLLLASFSASGSPSSPAALTTNTVRPAARPSRTISGNASAVAHSTITSACRASSASGTTAGAGARRAALARALSRSRAVTALKVMPGTAPATSRRATSCPALPNPARPTRIPCSQPQASFIASAPRQG
jgi:hypothetical protein